MPIEQNSIQGIGVVTGISGDAYAESAAGIRPLEPGSPIYQGENLVTGDGSNIEVRFADDTLISQGANSRIAIDEYVYDPDSSTSSFLGEIAQGTFRTVTGKIASENPDRFKLGSPLATIGIRGTIILSEVGPDGEKHGVEEIHAGRAMLLQSKATGQILQLFSGQMSDISGSGILSPVRPLSTQELNSFREIAPANIRQEQDIQDQQEEDQQDDNQSDEQSNDDQGNPGDQNAHDTSPEEGLGNDVTPGGGDPDETPGSHDGILHPGTGALDPGDDALVGQERFIPERINDLPKLDTKHEIEEKSLQQKQDEGQKEFSSDLEDDQTGQQNDETDSDQDEQTDKGTGDGNGKDDAPEETSSSTPKPDDDTDSSGDEDSSGEDDHTSGQGDDTSTGDVEYNNTITGTEGQTNTLTGTPDADQIIGREMADDISGMSGNDFLLGYGGNDKISGDDGNDSILGGAGNDTLFGNDGNDNIDGGTGADTISGGPGNDHIDGGTSAGDVDYVSYAEAETGVTVNLAAETATSDSGHDTIKNIEGIIGSDHLDKLTGDSGDNVFRPGLNGDFVDGNDTTREIVDGGSEQTGDTLDFSNITKSVYIDLNGNGDTQIEADEAIIYQGTILDSATINVVKFSSIEKFIGSQGDDLMIAGGGSATFDGSGGNDDIQGGSSVDFLAGGAGNDSISGGAGADFIDGGADSDWVDFSDSGLASTGVYISSAFTQTIDGVEYTLVKEADTNLDHTNTIVDYIANIENISGTESGDYIEGTAADNYIKGEGGADSLMGGDGSDTLSGGDGLDTLDGGAGNDDWVDYSYVTGSEELVLHLDSLSAGFAESRLNDFAEDKIKNIEHVIGTKNADDITGDSNNNNLMGGDGDDILKGGSGDDTLHGGAGTDALDGGDGNDLISYKGSSAAINIDLGNGCNDIMDGGTGNLSHSEGADIFIRIEGVIGSDVADTIKASALSADTIQGGKGADTITLTSSTTTLVYTDLDEGGDTVNNFSHCCDKFLFQGSDFESSASSKLETITSGNIYDGSTDVSYNDACFVFDTSTNSLYYDANGSGEGESTLIANFDSNPNLDAVDINVTDH
ncbi:FecR domain-containing protein [Maridesulfovibrio sp.]|uniref:FecR domain-containing protein n=1 Tax=Maridesulfovibrio sp. TaxID=2795000 RepID=UPI0029F4D908|nr:FecR domain-containing protein [Maridesulfovibrio sp.]